MTDDKKPTVLFIIDHGALIDLFEKKGASATIPELLAKARMEGHDEVRFATTNSAFVHALWKADGDTPLKNVHDVLDSLDVLPVTCEWKIEQNIVNELITLAKVAAKHKEDDK